METNEDFTIGNVVELKSGGPPMCLEDYNHDTEMYTCTWIHDGVSHRDNFYAYCLQKPKSKGGLFGDESETYAEKIEKAVEQIERMKIARYTGLINAYRR